MNKTLLLILVVLSLCLIQVEAGCYFHYCFGKRKLNKDTCKCECPNECGDNQHQDYYCRCKCKEKCTEPQTVQDPDTCECSCPDFDCPAPKSQKNLDNCECECPDGSDDCSANEVFNDDTCECDCALTQDDCGDNATLNEQLCTCIPNIVDCPDGKEEVNGECVCIEKECKKWQIQDPDTCECVKCPRKSCKKGYWWSSYKCKCIRSYYGHGYGYGHHGSRKSRKSRKGHH